MNPEEKRKIEEQIRALPKGTITRKRINGKEYEYWQFRENGRQVTKRVKGEELEILRLQIRERKRLEKLLKEMGSPAGERIAAASLLSEADHYHCLIRIGEDLQRFAEPVKAFRKREIYQQLHDYTWHPVPSLYGK